jgi:predicted DNA-binding ribbon-helix-helix protein
MKIENKNENIEMNINIKKDKFDNWDIVNYVHDYIKKYKKDIADLKELESQDRNESSMDYLTEIHKKLTLEKEFLLILENISKYARANEKQYLEEIYQIDEKTGNISKANNIDEILKYCMRTMSTLENNNSEFANGMLAVCKYIYYGIIANKIDNGEDVERYRT